MGLRKVVRFSLCGLGLFVALAGCASSPQKPNADAATLERAAYSDPSSPSMTLFTMVNNRTGKGGHTSLMVNASQRVIFDPAGSFKADVVPEFNDVLYGITPAVLQAYRGSHARSTFHVVIQEVALTPEQAAAAYHLVTTNGRVPGAYCANATSALLAQVPGFESIDRTFYPVNLQEQFGALPGVKTERYYENDSEDLHEGIAAGNRTLNQL